VSLLCEAAPQPLSGSGRHEQQSASRDPNRHFFIIHLLLAFEQTAHSGHSVNFFLQYYASIGFSPAKAAGHTDCGLEEPRSKDLIGSFLLLVGQALIERLEHWNEFIEIIGVHPGEPRSISADSSGPSVPDLVLLIVAILPVLCCHPKLPEGQSKGRFAGSLILKRAG